MGVFKGVRVHYLFIFYYYYSFVCLFIYCSIYIYVNINHYQYLSVSANISINQYQHAQTNININQLSINPHHYQFYQCFVFSVSVFLSVLFSTSISQIWPGSFPTRSFCAACRRCAYPTTQTRTCQPSSSTTRGTWRNNGSGPCSSEAWISQLMVN